MKRLMMISALTLAVVTLMAPLPAETAVVAFGEPLTYSFDFTSQSPSPPYDGYGMRIQYNALTSPGFVEISYNPTFPGIIVGFTWADVGSNISGSEVYYPPGSNIFPGTFDVTFYISDYLPNIGTRVDITNVGIRMIDVVGSDPDTRVYTEWLAGTPVAPPVPEPSTLLLLGSGLLGLVGYGRKRMKE